MRLPDLPGDIRDPLVFLAVWAIPMMGARLICGWSWGACFLVGAGVLLSVGFAMVLWERSLAKQQGNATWDPRCRSCNADFVGVSGAWDASSQVVRYQCAKCNLTSVFDSKGGAVTEPGDIVLRLDRETAKCLRSALYAMGEFQAAGREIPKRGERESALLGKFLCDLDVALGGPGRMA